MSLWSQLFGSGDSRGQKVRDRSRLAFIDLEVSLKDHRIHDIGAINQDDVFFHAADKERLFELLRASDFICGHNIIHHDLKYLFEKQDYMVSHSFGKELKEWVAVDTLYISPLLFPERPYHKLVKDDKLVIEQLNNPVNDCIKARDLLVDEISKWRSLSSEKKAIFKGLLSGKPEFDGFLTLVSDETELFIAPVTDLISEYFNGRICANADLDSLIKDHPVALAYSLALIDTTDYRSVTPPWVLHNYPDVEYVVKILRHTRCGGCPYCNKELDIHRNLKCFYGYDAFRTYDGEPLQENAVRAAVDGKSLLAIFPTGGGKSLTFQLPALMAGRAEHGLTVVISPLQSLMKDQVDNLADKGISDAVTINGLLDPISRSSAIERVRDGDASLLYIAPEMLRSKTIEKILMTRRVVRFVIDEAHCFSSWGQDFRVDYMYIGKFIREYQKNKGYVEAIPVSCFTATAKQKVVQDICDYFKNELDVDLSLFASAASRTNLRYSVIHAETDDDKYVKLRALISESDCPVIVYVSRTKRTKELADRLTHDGFKALPFNGKMDVDQKVLNQDAFMNDEVRIIVATSAFGMGVDKSDVGLVIHYDISDSLENYVQEAGRAGRDPHLEARCFVLYSDHDLDKHFILLNQTKLSISEIQQVWRSVKNLTRQRQRVCCSALEIARNAGWDDSVHDIETRVRTAIAALEQSGYLERGNNMPHVYATGITVNNMDEARERLSKSILFDEDDREKAARVIKSLISQKYRSRGVESEAESRIDYLADILALSKSEVISVVGRMVQEGILADTKDLTVYLRDSGDTERKSNSILERFAKLERFILESIPEEGIRITCKQLNENAITAGITHSTEKSIRTILYFLFIKGYVRKRGEVAGGLMEIDYLGKKDTNQKRLDTRQELSRYIIGMLYAKDAVKNMAGDNSSLQFSTVELLDEIQHSQSMFFDASTVKIEDIEEALLYLSKIGSLKIEGGFLVIYNTMDIRRLKDNRLQYKKDDYRMLDEFYKQKIQQVHIVGEYANLMVRDYNAALQYVSDYFRMDYRRFVSKYFKGDRAKEIERNITSAKYKQLFGQLSETQMEIISDKESRCIVVAAGPGSGKTRVLVHKLASILLLEDVKHEQLLMLTFSRAAATEFKDRLIELIGNAAQFVEIKTFHSYSFDLLGRVGNLDDANDVVAKATNLINAGEVEPSRIAKAVLVIDEAQDMSQEDFALVKAIMDRNEEMRVIAVGDDDQNIFEFRGSDSRFMRELAMVPGGRFIEMTQNYRSKQSIVNTANAFVPSIKTRLKTAPIVAMNPDAGRVEVIHHKTEMMYEPLVQNLMRHRNGRGTACVLAQTNEEAVVILAMLLKNGIAARLVQTLDGFRFCNLAEIKYLFKYIGTRLISPLVPDELWESAKTALSSRYSRSTVLPYVLNCMAKFEKINSRRYWSDFKEFVNESSVEDFYEVNDSEIMVSTIHKSKGREFDDVYMMVADHGYSVDDSLMRRFYVGMTRAKDRLFIHTDSIFFSRLPADGYYSDSREYPMPEDVVLQLSHRDVNLGFFKMRKKEVLSLCGGDPLLYSNNTLYLKQESSNDTTGLAVAYLSNAMQKKLADWSERGYEVVSASVRFIVAWKPKDAPVEEPEYAVLLADLSLKRRK